MIDRDIFEKCDNLSEDELSEKSNKSVYVKIQNRKHICKRKNT